MRNRLAMWQLAAIALAALTATSGCDTHATAVSEGESPERNQTTFPRPASGTALSLDGVTGEWSNWRGPETQGVATDARLPNPWPSQPPELMWSFALGTGWSSPIVSDGRIFVSDRNDDVERLVALDAASGALLWDAKHEVEFDPHAVGRRHGNGPKSTPVARDGKVYWLGIAGHLECLDAATGKTVWQISLPRGFGEQVALSDGRAYVNGTDNVIVPIGNGQGAPVPLFGYTGSPTFADGKLILEVGGARGGTLMAFDAVTGNVGWKSLDGNVSYSSPIVAEVAGTRQVIAMTGPRVVGLALDDGRLLWSHPFQIQYDESISTPVLAGDLVMVTGDGRPLTALRIRQEGDRVTSSVAWENDELSSYLSTPVVRGKHVYGMNDDGEFICIALADGETAWHGGNHGFYSSPVLAGDRLLALNEVGELAVLAATPEGYQPLGSSVLSDDATWTVPAVIGNLVYVRTGSDVCCLRF